MALDVTARNTGLGQDIPGEQASSVARGGEGDGDDVPHQSHMESKASLHPLDVLCAVLLCSDSFLQQELLSKMSMCQFALPLLLPALDTPRCTLMLWAMRDIVRKWRPHSLAESRGFREESLVLTKVPTVSFVRLGSCSLSKSQLLNEVLSPSQQHHDFFVHRDMESGNIPREMADGLVEIAWYFPGGKESSELFPEPCAVINLRGDIESHWLQFSFLTKISSVVFIVSELISEGEYELLSSLQGPATKYYFIFNNQAGKAEETLGVMRKLAPVLTLNPSCMPQRESVENTAQFVKDLRSAIEAVINSSPKRMSIEDMAEIARELSIQVDEDAEESQSARKHAKEITAQIKDVLEYKREKLRLQGEAWKTLAEVEKELCRLRKQGDVPVENYRSQLKQELLELRVQQNKCELTDGLTTFIAGIDLLPPMEKQYFLKWITFDLGHIVRENLSNLLDQYREKYKSSKDNPELCAELDKSISANSLGLEHFVRELGQFYESEFSMVKEGKMEERQRQYVHLPGIAADLMLEGFPMELVDGDVSNVPLQWVTDVLTELHTKLEGRSRMLVLSVLGAQSTGKSTLLNTMFRLQFAVSSGRYTRGAFMSLIKVAENFQQELGCDFLLVIDTESLKASELGKLEDSYEHDNELATLVIGLSDIAIITMPMEKVTETKDILQIVVHAFLRVKEIGQPPQCLFVHQNVSDVSAHEQNRRDREHLLEQLNEMTEAAARMEKLCKEVAFSDIMSYDPETQDWNLPGLWHGFHPMAPVNLGYSKSVGQLKKHLLELLKIHSGEMSPKNVPQFTEWMKSLCNALKHENFCFSFRNPFATEAYNQLSAKFSELEWEFQKTMHLWLSEQETFIQNQAPDELNSELLTQLSQETQQKLQCEEDKIFECLEKYIKGAASSTHMLELKEDFVRSSRSTVSTFDHYSHHQLERAKNRRKRQGKCYNTDAEFRKIIEEEVDKLLEDCRSRECKLTNEELEREFQAMWRKLVPESMLFSSMTQPIFQEMQSLLEEDLESRGRLMPQEAVNLLHYTVSSFTMKKEYLDLTWSDTLKELFKKGNWFKAEEIATSLIEECSAYIDEKTNSNAPYDEIYCKELLCMINERLQQEEVSKLHMNGSFEVDLKLHILGEAAKEFQKIHVSFMRETDPRQSLKKLKLQYFSILKDLYLDKEVSHKRARDFCDQCLKPALVDYMNKRLGIVIADDILRNGQSIDYASRGFFQFTTQKKLLEENHFQSYLEYIENYEAFVKTRIQRHLVDHYRRNERLEDLETAILSTAIEKVRGALEDSKDKLDTVSVFLDNFCKVLQKDLVISKDSLVGIRFINTVNVVKFVAFIQTFLSDLETQILAEFENLEIESKFSLLSVKPQEEIFKRVFGCGKQCPFCKVPCEAVGTDHREHFASVHRPQGLGAYCCIETGKLVDEMCSSAVLCGSTFQCPETQWKPHPFKDYRDIFPDWHIQPDPNIHTSDYWKFVFKEFNQEFAEAFRAEPAELPEEWEKITSGQALESLEEAFQMK
ncbi:up-regulator of cell proliferation-like [Carettochelys insculpta]|uniref:up-regulator of cell proliferation-like n=1 Tax=Carettochelys insculpta TaxID=44489 RepID=UPI003EB85C76